MESLHALAQSLSEKEIGIVRNYLNSFSTHKGSEEILGGKLFNYLLRKKSVPSKEDCCVVVYGTHRKEEKTFLMLKSRLKTKILEAINSEVNVEKNEMLYEVDYETVRIKKKAAQLRQLFYSKPGLSMTRDLLEEIISECKKYELYAMLIEHLEFKKYRYTYKEGSKAFDSINTEIEKHTDCYRAITIANDYYYKRIQLTEFGGKYNKEKVQSFLKSALNELRSLYVKTKSNMVNYYLKYLEMDYYLNEKNYEVARGICYEIGTFISDNPPVYRKERMGIAHNYISRCELFLGDYKNAATQARIARQHCSTYSDNYSTACEQEFYALFYSLNYPEATRAALDMLHNATKAELGEFHYAKYNFMHACILFKQNKFEEALDIVYKPSVLSKDKEGWEMGIRLLGIMAHIEIGNEAVAEKDIENLKKFIEFNKKDKTFSKREVLIANILLRMKNTGFDLCFLKQKTKRDLSLLSGNEEDYKWEILTPELIPFHEWAADKIKEGALLRA